MATVWETAIRWCYVHEVSAVEDLDHCWKEQWLKDQGQGLEWRRCRIINGRLTIESLDPVGQS